MSVLLGGFLRRLRQTLASETPAGPDDSALLERFVRLRDEAAFEVLFWRHGPMVLGVCRRLLSSTDAEDAFQATFLVLVRKAASISRRESVGSWLYRVAYRICLRARMVTAKHSTEELPSDGVAANDESEDLVWRDLKPVIDEEIARLPEKYRAPIVMCYLQGKTNEEAAQLLGCPKGTVAVRLMRARTRLHARLSRRGLALSVAILVASLANSARGATVPPALASLTLKAALLEAAGRSLTATASTQALALAQGVIRDMLMSKLKMAALLLVAIALIGGGLVWWHPQTTATAAPPERNDRVGDKEATPRDKPATDKEPASQDKIVEVASPVSGIVQVIGSTIKPGEDVPAARRCEAKIDGAVVKFRKLKEGDRVEVGQLVGRIDSDEASLAVEISVVKLKAAKADVESTQKTSDEAKVRWDRAERLAANGAGTREEADAARLTFQRYRSESIQKGEIVQVAEKEVQLARNRLAQHEIRSRVNGVIVQIRRYPGEGVKALDPVMSIRVEEK
jgi:RNA polymerase sigma factor (sigma-70 family)